jgi:hypothetical protein
MSDVAVLLNALGTLYIEKHRFGDARQMLDRALAIFAACKDTVPMDCVTFVLARAMLYMKQSDWRDVERNLRECIAIVGEKPPDASLLNKIP